MDLSILTWNIAKAETSFSAPAHWKEEYATETHAALRYPIVHNRPDFLALQEIPSVQWLPHIVSFSDYIPIGTAPSHCGHTALLIKTTKQKSVRKVFQIGPAVVGIFDWNGLSIALCSAHLYPGKEGKEYRKIQMEAIVRLCESQNIAHWIIVGDMNMRKEEEETIESLPSAVPLVDVWKQQGDTNNRWTWDSYQNRYHPKSHPFRARFDRVYLYSSILKTQEFVRIGDKPLENPHHFPSDHFGIYTVFQF